jgi:hypothetical protein
MADHRVRFTLGSHIRSGSLDFLCIGVDHDLVQLPPSVLIDHASLLSFNKHVGDLDPTSVEGECASPSPVESLSSPANIELHLRVDGWSLPACQRGKGFSRLERQLDAILGPRPS